MFLAGATVPVRSGAVSKRDARVLARVAVAFFAFSGSGGIDGDGDISDMSAEDMALGEKLLERATEADIAAAIAQTEADIAAVSRAS